MFKPDDSSLISGHWAIKEDARIVLKNGESITTLGRGVTVNLAAGSSINNLPVVEGNFTLEEGAELILNSATFTTSNDFYAGGRLGGLDGTIQVIGTLYNGTQGGLTNAILTGNLTINANGGVVSTAWTAPGDSPGTITINGDFTQTDTGTLQIEVFGAEAGTEYDQLIVNGTATLGGTLHIIPNIDFPDSSLFVPLVATTVEGVFDRIIVENKSARETYDVSKMETGIQISPTTLSVSSFAEFQNALFSDDDIIDETIGLTTSDPDGDQFSNLLEYAMDLNPWVTNKNPMEVNFEPAAIEGFSRVKVKFPWAKDMTDVDYVIQISPDMTVWSDLSSTVEDTIDEGTHELLTVGADIDVVVTGRLFVRVLVNQKEL
ncbi:MAG: hypothetical protein O3C43_13985 [Verrucomicrobia bacterium]|nr:hypothetical protein [Verrucomicrobiota bacterium]MDA1067601.1 hypothetical protein [Verrucomicrobiota bacterium]